MWDLTIVPSILSQHQSETLPCSIDVTSEESRQKEEQRYLKSLRKRIDVEGANGSIPPGMEEQLLVLIDTAPDKEELLGTIPELFKTTFGVHVPYQHFGHRTLKSLLNTMPSVSVKGPGASAFVCRLEKKNITNLTPAAIEHLRILDHAYPDRVWPTTRKQLKEFAFAADTTFEPPSRSDATKIFLKKRKKGFEKIFEQYERIGCLNRITDQSLEWDFILVDTILSHHHQFQSGSFRCSNDVTPTKESRQQEEQPSDFDSGASKGTQESQTL